MFMWWLFTMLFASFQLRFSLIVPITLRSWGIVRLRPFVFFMDSFFFLSGSQARWPLPLISLLSLLASCFVLSLWCATYHLFTMPPILPCHPLTFSPFLANHCLAMLPLLLSPSYSVARCRWRWRLLHVGLCLCWDITISLILINASIYLVKGGRLGLMPGV